MGSPVSLVRCKSDRSDLTSSIAKAVDLIGFRRGKKVNTAIIKPNLNYYWEANTGCTTDPQLVAALIDYLRSEYGNNVTIKVAEADASAMKTKHVFPMLGYDKLAKDKRVELFNLSNDALRTEKVSINGHEIELEVPQSLLETDLFINVPKLKSMRVTKMTCAMKNIFGCIGTPRKFVYHPILNETIVGINRVLRPHLTIVDGLVALGRFPVRLDLIIGGTDVFSIDWIASQILGLNPKSVKFLKMAMHEKVGSPKGIVTLGESLSQFRQKMPKDGVISQKLLWGIEIKMLRLYKRVSGDVIPPFLEEG